MLEIINYKGYEITHEKINNIRLLKHNAFKWRYVFYTKKQALDNFVELLKSSK